MVKIIDSAQAVAAESVDSLITFWVIEDDEVPCEIHLGNEGKANSVYQAIFHTSPYDSSGAPGAWRNRFSYHVPDPVEVFLLRAGWQIFQSIVGSDNDDIVGLMVPPADVGQSYTDANMAIVNRNFFGYMDIVGRARLLRFTTPPSSPPSFSVSISGPTTLGPNNYTCGQWSASVTGGQSPYQYEWSGLFSGTDSYVSGAIPQSGSNTIYLTVIDNQGRYGSISLEVSYDSNNLDYCE